MQRRAEECRALAEQAHHEHERATILRMAEQWKRLAERKATKEPPTEAASLSDEPMIVLLLQETSVAIDMICCEEAMVTRSQ